MKWIKPIILTLILFTFLPVAAFAELNKSKDEDIQTLVVEIVDKKASEGTDTGNSSKGSSGKKFSLPQTGESKGVISWLGIGLFGTVLGGSLLIYKRGDGKYEAK